MDAVLHRIEALPGVGRYAVSFKIGDGSEQSAVMHVDGDDIDVAEASLPPGWTFDTDAFRAVAVAVRAMATARDIAPLASVLRDADGGWDVMLGNVVIGSAGVPVCTAHDAMEQAGDVWSCPECGARALLG